MKVSGFTFCRDAVRFDYPIVESIRSILPIVDEYIVNVGKSEDGTLELIHSMENPKIKVIESVWDESLRKDGLVYSQQTNIALDHCTGDWAFYLQADEVVNEEDLPKLKTVMEQFLGDPKVLGFMFCYLHFKGDYYSIDPWMYRREIRIIRNNGKVRSMGDAVGFSKIENGNKQNLKSGVSFWKPTGARIFHYGWVKNPRTLNQKKRVQVTYYHGYDIPEHGKILFEKDVYSFDKYSILKEFHGTHPSVMTDRIKQFPRLAPRKSRWLNPRFYLEVLKHGFKG